MSINDKIKQILIDKNLTPSYFADEIGVQRSSISHILSGRNRPSFDIIQKIIRRFPELGYEWIMEEDAYGSTTNQPSTYSNRISTPARSATDRVPNGQPSFYSYGSQPSVRSQRTEIPPVSQHSQPMAEPADSAVEPIISSNPSTDKKVERILIFYTDGSFKEYTPSL
ncbi:MULTISPECIES: helix-turn-helix transcriptional regulator [unclassified Spirosoma]|uniref:helix-turn-helix transcriptional regulator n=1 Tax=unclassified Spirosoma TaxID=2621999 RepID=UPI000B166B3F|nr:MULTISPECIES: helix-turn-helix transcriptional regulator [unclassified Spirosoma]MBN8825675.1 helix-turn-helix transcriptional regulator [Spirosoma sp.]